MDIEQARKVINSDASFTEVHKAVMAITTLDSPDYRDLLICLRHKGISAEMAAVKLYVLTGRDRGDSIQDLSIDSGDWEVYLSGKGLI